MRGRLGGATPLAGLEDRPIIAIWLEMRRHPEPLRVHQRPTLPARRGGAAGGCACGCAVCCCRLCASAASRSAWRRVISCSWPISSASCSSVAMAATRTLGQALRYHESAFSCAGLTAADKRSRCALANWPGTSECVMFDWVSQLNNVSNGSCVSPPGTFPETWPYNRCS